MNAESPTEILETTGLVVERAADGTEAVDRMSVCQDGYYDLILMDSQMPNRDGYKATQTIRLFSDKQKSTIPIIDMTANAFEEDKKNAYKAGMNGHVGKPINVSELFATLASMIGKREAFHSNPQCPDFGQSGRGKKDFLKINCYSCGDLR